MRHKDYKHRVSTVSGVTLLTTFSVRMLGEVYWDLWRMWSVFPVLQLGALVRTTQMGEPVLYYTMYGESMKTRYNVRRWVHGGGRQRALTLRTIPHTTDAIMVGTRGLPDDVSRILSQCMPGMAFPDELKFLKYLHNLRNSFELAVREKLPCLPPLELP